MGDIGCAGDIGNKNLFERGFQSALAVAFEYEITILIDCKQFADTVATLSIEYTTCLDG